MILTNPSPKSVLKKYPDGSIFQGFGENVPDYIPLGYSKGHPGWDILAYDGAPIVAAHAGRIVDIWDEDVTRSGGIGVWLASLDGKMLTSYSHLKHGSLKIKKGDIVMPGNQIAQMGNTGFVISGGVKYWGNAPAGKGVHLHFGIVPTKYVNGVANNHQLDFKKEFPTNGHLGYVDPTPYFTDSIKAETPEQTLLRTALIKMIEAYRWLARYYGKEPAA